MMMESGDIDFSDILQQAEQLSAEIDSTHELPRVQRNLRQVLEAGQQLLERTNKDGPRIDAETKAAIFLGTKGVDVTKLAEKLDPMYFSGSTTVEHHDSISEVDVDEFLRNERMNAMCAVVESTTGHILEEIQDGILKKMDEDWENEKEEISAMLSGSLRSLQFEKVVHDFKPDPITVLTPTELTYAYEISAYNTAIINNTLKPNILERLNLASKNQGDANLQELWASVVAMASGLPLESQEKMLNRRASEPFMDMMISRARGYLEKTFFKRMQAEVWSRLQDARLGGVPGATQLVKSYITLKGLGSTLGLEVGAGDTGPVWLTVYLLLRCGKPTEAHTYLRDTICNTEFDKFLDEYIKSGCTRLPSEMETRVRMDYRIALQCSSRDPYKKALYSILGGCDEEDDHAEVAHRLDDYLWLKLCVVRHNSDGRYTQDFITYPGFQNLISEQYGEVYFDAFKQPYVYTQALILTGQFEAAIEFMSRVSGMLTHAIHVAVALNETGLLLLADAKSPILSRKEHHPPGIKLLNYCKLMFSFASSLQGCNVREALNYLYLLKNIKDKHGDDLFSITVSDLVLETRDFDLFGVMNMDGCRTPGLLEQMGINVQPIIMRCAGESEIIGLLEDAVILYDLAGNHEQTLKILCRVIGQHLNKNPLPDSPRQRIQRLAIAYAERFQHSPPKLRDPSLVSTFYMLVDFMTFFDTVYAKQLDNALTIIQRLKVIPLDRADVEKCKVDFHTFADEIRTNIPSLIVAAMETIHTKYQNIKAGRKGTFSAVDIAKTEAFLDDLKSKARALVTYCGMIPYFMTGDVYTKVMQIEVQMN